MEETKPSPPAHGGESPGPKRNMKRRRPSITAGIAKLPIKFDKRAYPSDSEADAAEGDTEDLNYEMMRVFDEEQMEREKSFNEDPAHAGQRNFPDLKRWTLSFKNPEMEKAYRMHTSGQTRSKVRRSFLVMFLMHLILGVLEPILGYSAGGEREVGACRAAAGGLAAALWLLGYALGERAFYRLVSRPLPLYYLVSSALLTLMYSLGTICQCTVASGGCSSYSFLSGMWSLPTELMYTVVCFSGGMRLTWAAIVFALHFTTSLLLPLLLVQWFPDEDLSCFYKRELVFVPLLAALCATHGHDLELQVRFDFWTRCAIARDRRRREDIVESMLPKKIAAKLKEGYRPHKLAKKYPRVTIVFCYICNFKELSLQTAPGEIVRFLHRLYSAFDQATDVQDVYKVEAIAESYICVSGLKAFAATGNRPEPDKALSMAALMAAIGTRVIRRPDGQPVALKIGVHTGRVVAGVTGSKSYSYHLFGDAVNTASRMATTCREGCVQLSRATYQEISQGMQARCRPNAPVEVKGKGRMETFDLNLLEFDESKLLKQFWHQRKMRSKFSPHFLDQNMSLPQATQNLQWQSQENMLMEKVRVKGLKFVYKKDGRYIHIRKGLPTAGRESSERGAPAGGDRRSSRRSSSRTFGRRGSWSASRWALGGGRGPSSRGAAAAAAAALGGRRGSDAAAQQRLLGGGGGGGGGAEPRTGRRGETSFRSVGRDRASARYSFRERPSEESVPATPPTRRTLTGRHLSLQSGFSFRGDRANPQAPPSVMSRARVNTFRSMGSRMRWGSSKSFMDLDLTTRTPGGAGRSGRRPDTAGTGRPPNVTVSGLSGSRVSGRGAGEASRRGSRSLSVPRERSSPGAPAAAGGGGRRGRGSGAGALLVRARSLVSAAGAGAGVVGWPGRRTEASAAARHEVALFEAFKNLELDFRADHNRTALPAVRRFLYTVAGILLVVVYVADVMLARELGFWQKLRVSLRLGFLLLLAAALYASHRWEPWFVRRMQGVVAGLAVAFCAAANAELLWDPRLVNLSVNIAGAVAASTLLDLRYAYAVRANAACLLLYAGFKGYQILAGPAGRRREHLEVAVGLLAYLGLASYVGSYECWKLEKERRYNFLHKAILEHDRDMSEQLLKNMLPGPHLVHALIEDVTVADELDRVTMLFSDFKGYTAWCNGEDPETVYKILNVIYNAFDKHLDEQGVYKLETIGDAFVVVGGLPGFRSRENHALAVIKFAFCMLHELELITSRNGLDFEMRIGIHTGPVVGGVVGFKKPRYLCWGKSSLIANLLESEGTPGRILVSKDTLMELTSQELSLNQLVAEKNSSVVKLNDEVIPTYFINGDVKPFLKMNLKNQKQLRAMESRRSSRGSIGSQRQLVGANASTRSLLDLMTPVKLIHRKSAGGTTGSMKRRGSMFSLRGTRRGSMSRRLSFFSRKRSSAGSSRSIESQALNASSPLGAECSTFRRRLSGGTSPATVVPASPVAKWEEKSDDPVNLSRRQSSNASAAASDISMASEPGGLNCNQMKVSHQSDPPTGGQAGKVQVDLRDSLSYRSILRKGRSGGVADDNSGSGSARSAHQRKLFPSGSSEGSFQHFSRVGSSVSDDEVDATSFRSRTGGDILHAHREEDEQDLLAEASPHPSASEEYWQRNCSAGRKKSNRGGAAKHQQCGSSKEGCSTADSLSKTSTPRRMSSGGETVATKGTVGRVTLQPLSSTINGSEDKVTKVRKFMDGSNVSLDADSLHMQQLEGFADEPAESKIEKSAREKNKTTLTCSPGYHSPGQVGPKQSLSSVSHSSPLDSILNERLALGSGAIERSTFNIVEKDGLDRSRKYHNHDNNMHFSRTAPPDARVETEEDGTATPASDGSLLHGDERQVGISDLILPDLNRTID